MFGAIMSVLCIIMQYTDFQEKGFVYVTHLL
jgi:hypothetical protein